MEQVEELESVIMDDLDHSMFMAEVHWTSFYQESEECGLLQPRLACPDESCLSDAEAEENPDPGPGEGLPAGEQQVLVVDWDDSAGAEGTVERVKPTDLETSVNTTEKNDDLSNTHQSPVSAASPGPRQEEDAGPRSDPLILNQTEPQVTDQASRRTFTSRAAKERWFVTVDLSPEPGLGRAPTLKKKPRQRKGSNSNHTFRYKKDQCAAKSSQTGSACVGGRDVEDFNKPEPHPLQASGDLIQMYDEDQDVSEVLVFSQFHEEPVSETMMDEEEQEVVGSTSHEPSVVDHVESDDGAEFFSVHSYDSDSYLSAAESEEGRPSSSVSPGSNADGDRPGPPPSSGLTSPHDDVSTHLTLRTTSDTPVVQEDQAGRLGYVRPSPDGTLSSCPQEETPESFAAAAGQTQTIYAISAFWDHMEKLTIKDLLQLRTGRSETPAHESLRSLGLLDEGGVTELSDAADSDYFTQPDESKSNFSTWDLEEEDSSCPGPRCKTSERTSVSPLSSQEEVDSVCSERRETPIPLEYTAGPGSEDQDQVLWPRQLTKSKSLRNVRTLNQEDSRLTSDHDEVSRAQSLTVRLTSDHDEVSRGQSLKVSDQVRTSDLRHCLFLEDQVESESWCLRVYDQDTWESPVFDCTLGSLRDDMCLSSLMCAKDTPVPIFSSSSRSFTELTIPQFRRLLLRTDSEEQVENFSPIAVPSLSFIQTTQSAAAGRGVAGGTPGGGGDEPPGGGGTIPVEPRIRMDPAAAESKLFRERSELQIFQGNGTARRPAGIFSSLRQADMCLLCIAFASWVLTSSDPRAADAWKAALLAKVSALSAIQYLRHYLKKKRRRRPQHAAL